MTTRDRIYEVGRADPIVHERLFQYEAGADGWLEMLELLVLDLSYALHDSRQRHARLLKEWPLGFGNVPAEGAAPGIGKSPSAPEPMSTHEVTK